MLKNVYIKLLSILLLIFLTGCFGYISLVRYDSSFRGKVVDADTGEPIEGAVVLGTWYSEYPSISGPRRKYYDARETVTNKNGDFSIPGKGLRIISNLEPMDILIFKAGYKYIGPVSWDSLKEEDVIYFSKIIKWEGNKPIFPLKKLTMEERRRRSPPDPPREAPLEKVILMLKEMDKDDIELGLEPRGIWRGEEYE